VFALFPTPLPSLQGLSSMPWWAPFGRPRGRGPGLCRPHLGQ
jgi:hypothetical protein